MTGIIYPDNGPKNIKCSFFISKQQNQDNMIKYN